MSSKALYRKYRSKSLDEIVGQSHITDILKSALAQDKVAHAYLLTGPRGVGKTSIARILAHEINKLPYTDESTHLDIIEIDAASNNGVDDVRELREKAQVAPVSASRKIYIIDEVHMLSKPAFNALLKTLEEPPEHVVFILATTDIDKLPATIVSRVQRYGFRTISVPDLIKHMRYIADQEEIAIDDDALRLIAIHGDGSFRDSISLLDQMSHLAGKDSVITVKNIEDSLGLATSDLIAQLIEAYQLHNLSEIIRLLDEADASSVSPTTICRQMITTIRAQIAESPDLLPLLDSLTEVNRSSHPSIKLLTVLASGSLPAPKLHKTTALEHKPIILDAKPIPTIQKQPATIETTPEPKTLAVKLASKPITKRPATGEVDLDWNNLVNYAKENSIGLYTLLTKCTHRLSGSALTIYAGKAFNKKRLDDAKQRQALEIALSAIGCDGLDIETLPETEPPKDSQAARVAAIMGGGQEVNI